MTSYWFLTRFLEQVAWLVKGSLTLELLQFMEISPSMSRRRRWWNLRRLLMHGTTVLTAQVSQSTNMPWWQSMTKWEREKKGKRERNRRRERESVVLEFCPSITTTQLQILWQRIAKELSNPVVSPSALVSRTPTQCSATRMALFIWCDTIALSHNISNSRICF